MTIHAEFGISVQAFEKHQLHSDLLDITFSEHVT